MSTINLNDLMETMQNFLIIIAVVMLLIYICIALFLNRLNKLIYGKGTWMSFIPIFNIYLLGKLTINKIAGFILVLSIFLTSYYSTTINGVEKVYAILPSDIRIMVGSFSSIITFILFIYAIIKSKGLKKNKKNNMDEHNATDTNNVIPLNDISQNNINQINNPSIEEKKYEDVVVTKGTYVTLLVVFVIALVFIFFLPNIVGFFSQK